MQYIKNILELDYCDYVQVGQQIFFVWGIDCDKETAELIPVKCLRSQETESVMQQYAQTYPARMLAKLPMADVDQETVRRLFRLEVMPWELAEQGKYPFAHSVGKMDVTEEDVLTFIENSRHVVNETAIDIWRKIFSMNTGSGSFARYPEADSPGFSFHYLCE